MERNLKPSLRFACTNTTAGMEKCGTNYHCPACSKTVVDFTKKSEAEINRMLRNPHQQVCGVFKQSQLYAPFAKYAAATLLAASTLAGQGCAEEKINPDAIEATEVPSPVEEAPLTGLIMGEMPHDDDVFPDSFAEPIGGYDAWFLAIKTNLRYPKGADVKGRVFVELTISAEGKIMGGKVLKGISEAADKEALRAMTSLDVAFEPAKKDGVAVGSTLVLPVGF